MACLLSLALSNQPATSQLTEETQMTQDQRTTLSNAMPALAPPLVLLQMMTGYWGAQAVYIAAKLGVADLLTDGARPVGELAAATQTDVSSLYRLLRALASVGVFTETSQGAFALTPMADLLRT